MSERELKASFEQHFKYGNEFPIPKNIVEACDELAVHRRDQLALPHRPMVSDRMKGVWERARELREKKGIPTFEAFKMAMQEADQQPAPETDAQPEQEAGCVS